jgi:hypothetical protein
VSNIELATHNQTLKQKNEVKKSVQDQDEKVSSIDEKFKKEIEILNIKWKC